jgi:hypothetical protein
VELGAEPADGAGAGAPAALAINSLSDGPPTSVDPTGREIPGSGSTLMTIASPASPPSKLAANSHWADHEAGIISSSKRP